MRTPTWAEAHYIICTIIQRSCIIGCSMYVYVRIYIIYKDKFAYYTVYIPAGRTQLLYLK